MPLDKKDRAILAALAHDARMTWQAVGRRALRITQAAPQPRSAACALVGAKRLSAGAITPPRIHAFCP